jgi:hypothetical protein
MIDSLKINASNNWLDTEASSTEELDDEIIHMSDEEITMVSYRHPSCA